MGNYQSNLLLRILSFFVPVFFSLCISFSWSYKARNFLETKGVGNIKRDTVWLYEHLPVVSAPLSLIVLRHLGASRFTSSYTTALNCLSLLWLFLAVRVLLCQRRGGITDKNKGVRECHACVTFAATFLFFFRGWFTSCSLLFVCFRFTEARLIFVQRRGKKVSVNHIMLNTLVLTSLSISSTRETPHD